MHSFIHISTLFKTIEYKLNSYNDLEITELSVTGSRTKTIALNSIDTEEVKPRISLLSWMIMALGSFAIIATLFTSHEVTLVAQNLSNIIVFLACSTAALFFLFITPRCYVYRDTFSNNILFKLKSDSNQNQVINKFITDLNAAIEEKKLYEGKLINLKSKEKKEFEQHNTNITQLFNAGLIDEALYNRVCDSLHDKVFGNPQKHNSTNDNVIYLNQ